MTQNSPEALKLCNIVFDKTVLSKSLKTKANVSNIYDSCSVKSEVSKKNCNCAINVTNVSDNKHEQATSYNACNTTMKDTGNDFQTCATLGLVKRG